MNKKNIEEYFKGIEVIGFDADDTLWVNETFFREAEDNFCKIMNCYETENHIRKELFKKEIGNLNLYGYGIKGFILSMMECAIEISQNNLDSNIQRDILNIGKEMLNKPVELLPTVRESLEYLSKKNYRLLLLTKGDLLDQERKLEKSGLTHFFHHVEVLSNKYSKNYADLLKHLSINPEEFLMIGNSLRSDVIPLLEINARAVHIPFHTTWEHEEVKEITHNNFISMSQISELTEYL